jgi:hypothetical protein
MQSNRLDYDLVKKNEEKGGFKKSKNNKNKKK